MLQLALLNFLLSYKNLVGDRVFAMDITIRRRVLKLLILIIYFPTNYGNIQSFGPEGEVAVGSPIKLSCKISGFTSASAQLKRNGTTINSCSNGNFCNLGPSKNISNAVFTFEGDANGIYVTINPLSSDELGINYECLFSGQTEDYILALILLFVVALTSSGLILGIEVPIISATAICGIFGLHGYMYRKRRVLKILSLFPKIGSRVLVIVNHDVARTVVKSENAVHEYDVDKEAFIFRIPKVDSADYGLYKFFIVLDSIAESENVTITGTSMDPAKHEIFSEEDMATNSGDDKDIATNSGDDKGKEQVRIEVHFEVNHEELVTIQNPQKYIFKDKYTHYGVTFMGIQILVVAFIFELISLITTAGALPLLYYFYGKYNTNLVIPASCALAVAIADLGTGLYVLTVICWRKKKDEKKTTCVGTDSSRCFRTVLLVIVIILPLAWLLLITMLIFNKCRQLSDSKKNDTVFKMQTHEKRCSANSIMPKKHDGDLLKNVPKDRRLPPIIKKDDSDENKKHGNARTKKQSKKEKKEKKISIIQENNPMESAIHSEKGETDSNMEHVNTNASH